MAYIEHLRRGTARAWLPLAGATLMLLLLGSWLWTGRASAYVFWTDCPSCHTATIARANQNGSEVNESFVGVHHTTIAEGLAISGDTLYWSWESPDYSSAFSPVVQDGIGQANLEGYGHEQFTFIGNGTPAYYPSGLAAAGKYLYSGFGNPGPLWSTKIDGPAPWEFPSANADASGVAASGGYVYWADDATNKIVRAKLNGSGGVKEVDGSFISGAHVPYGIAVGGGYIYWANEGTNTIGRAKLDGKSVNQKFIGGAHCPRGVAIDSQYIYWANFDGGSIGRAKLDGKSVNQKFITGANHPQWLAVGGPPANVSAPKISGTAQQGNKLTEAHGSWLNGKTSYSYQWERCDAKGFFCAEIAGATHQTYMLSSTDVGHRIVVRESASNADGTGGPASSAATSVVLPPPPSNTGAPTISGSTIQGQTLTGTRGSWSNSPTSFEYQWEDCNAAGTGCSPSPSVYSGWESYPLTLADAGSTIRLRVWAGNAGGTSAAAVSDATKVVLPLPPINLSSPSISGDLTQGQTLTEVPGSWSNDPASRTYQWQDCNSSGADCVPIPGATAPTYLLGAADVGDTIAVEEAVANAGGAGGPVSSQTTAVVQALSGGNVTPMAPLDSLLPVISGLFEVGQMLTASTGAWQGTPALTYTYQWQLCKIATCTDLPGATSSSYTLSLFPALDGGDTIQVVVTATNDFGSATAESAKLGPVPTSPPPPRPPAGGGLPM
jgi:hypothetical protein